MHLRRDEAMRERWESSKRGNRKTRATTVSYCTGPGISIVVQDQEGILDACTKLLHALSLLDVVSGLLLLRKYCR